jgi:hypothetical protein
MHPGSWGHQTEGHGYLFIRANINELLTNFGMFEPQIYPQVPYWRSATISYEDRYLQRGMLNKWLFHNADTFYQHIGVALVIPEANEMEFDLLWHDSKP